MTPKEIAFIHTALKYALYKVDSPSIRNNLVKAMCIMEREAKGYREDLEEAAQGVSITEEDNENVMKESWQVLDLYL